MPKCTTCDIDSEDYIRIKAVLQEMAEATPPEDAPYEKADFEQANAVYALSHIAPTTVEMLAITFHSARLQERENNKAVLEAADKLAEAAGKMFGPTKGKTGDERDELDTALSAYYAAKKA